MASWRFAFIYLLVIGVAIFFVRRRERYTSRYLQDESVSSDGADHDGRRIASDGTQSRKKVYRGPATLPENDGRQWRSNDYRVIPSATGVLAVQKGRTVVYGFFSQLTYSRCEDPQRFCVRFPNGQSVEISPEISQLVPSGTFHEFNSAARMSLGKSASK